MATTLPSWARRRRPFVSSLTLVSVASLLVSLYLPAAQAAWSLLPKKRFRYQGLIDAGTLGLNDIGAGIVAWGDWNGDQYLDAFVLSDDRRTLYLRLWDHTDFAFSSHPLFGITSKSGQEIVNVVPADFNHDGHLDVLLMTRSGNSNDRLEMEVWLGKGGYDGAITETPLSVPASTLAQPIVADGTGDMQIDLLGQPFSTDASGSLGKFRMWKNSFTASNGSQAFEVVEAPLFNSTELHPNREQPCKLANPHSSAFTDLDGDCLADLFLICADTHRGRQKFQIWTASKSSVEAASGAQPVSGAFVFSRSGYLPAGAGPLSFADMNRDGTTDVVFASCEGKECFINVVYNQQVGLCEKRASATGGSVENTSKSWLDWWYGSDGLRGIKEGENADNRRCRKTDQLCVADSKYSFDFDGKDSNSQARIQVPFSSLGLSGHTPLTQDSLSQQPVSLAIGDFDKNGYPDLLLITAPPGQSSNGNAETRLHILRNVRCSVLSAKARAACEKGSSDEEEGRWFEVVQEGGEVLDGIDDARSVSWLDIDNDGSLDLMILRGRQKDRGVQTVTFVQNNYFYDAFFLKVLTLNGACSSFCEDRSGDEVQTYRPWGAMLPGASYKFTVLDPNGNRRAQQVGQLAQTSYRPLLAPYSYFGLGRTNNYVENLLVGSTLHAPRHFLSMEGVIPNSQVVVSPYINKDAKPEDIDPSTWKRELYLKPGDWIPWVTLTLATLIAALCSFVFAMNVKERREDERDRKRAVHAINFDALG